MNPYEDEKWAVHIQGPDNVYAAKDFNQAAEKAAKFNRYFVKLIPLLTRFTSKEYPIAFAQVVRWRDVSNEPHNPEETDWDAF